MHVQYPILYCLNEFQSIFFSPLHGSIFYHSSFLLLLLCKQKTNTVNNKQSMYCCFYECLCIVQEYTRKFWMIGEKCSLSWTDISRCLLLYRNIYYYITYYVCHASVTMTIFQTNHFLFAFLLLLACSQCFFASKTIPKCFVKTRWHSE